MERKAIQLAGKTLVVSLPSKWAKKYGIKKGDTLFVEEGEKELLVKTSKDVEIEKLIFDAKGPDEFIKRKIDVAYKKGVEELRLSFESPKTIKIIEELLDTTMGFEIIRQEEKSCTIKSIAATVEGEFDNILRRIFLTILSMAEESYESLADSKFQKLKEISSYDKKVNKLTNFCKRVLNKKGYSKQQLTTYVYCIVWELERIGDEYKEICRQTAEAKGGRISKDILALYRETNNFLRNFYDLFYQFSETKGIELTNKKKSISEKVKSLIPKKKGVDSIVLHHLANIINATYDIAGPYYAMIM